VTLFFDFMHVHEDLDRALAAHQEALVGLDLGRAAEALAEYDRLLRAHIREEEKYVLPLYESLVPGACDIDIYKGEHRRFEAFLDELRGRVAALAGVDRPRAAAVAIFDREAVLKQVLQHHDLRERNALYPALDRHTTPEERAAVFAAMERGGPLPGGRLSPPKPAPPEAWRRVVDVRIGHRLTAVKLASGAIGLADTPGGPISGATREEQMDPESLVGRDALELSRTGVAGSPVDAAVAAAAADALAGGRRPSMPERFMTLITRGAGREEIVRVE
jgi:hypothetical protein